MKPHNLLEFQPTLLRFSHNGKLLAALNKNLNLSLWTFPDLNLQHYREQLYVSMCFSSDDTLIATGKVNCFQICDVKTFKILKTFEFVRTTAYHVCFSPDSEYLFAHDSARIVIVSIRTGKIEFHAPYFHPLGRINVAKFSTDSRCLYVGTSIGQLIVVDISARTWTINIHVCANFDDIMCIEIDKILCVGKETFGDEDTINNHPTTVVKMFELKTESSQTVAYIKHPRHKSTSFFTNDQLVVGRDHAIIYIWQNCKLDVLRRFTTETTWHHAHANDGYNNIVLISDAIEIRKIIDYQKIAKFAVALFCCKTAVYVVMDLVNLILADKHTSFDVETVYKYNRKFLFIRDCLKIF